MELLNPAFVILVIKISVCVLPGVFGIYLIASSEESKRNLRNAFCNRIFGVSNAIAYPKFARFLYIFGSLILLASLGISWVLLIMPQLGR
ncbi:MAG: hypothetical protein ACOCVJ_00250 [Verrucomicrobiota bacterium]